MTGLAEHLERTSRTFALSIPLLPEGLRQPVMVSYLLFRIADTVEDEVRCPADLRAASLRAVAECFESEFAAAGCEIADSVLGTVRGWAGGEVAHAGYSELLSALPEVLSAYAALPGPERAIIARHLARTARGMADFLGRDLSEGTTSDLRGYCYVVAGIVGEMLTELFALRDAGAAGVSRELMRDAAAFGEGLQLVNIVRDATDDLHAGRCYLPRALGRAELMGMAREGLEGALRYVSALERAGADGWIVAFNVLNACLAARTLDAVWNTGPGAKVARSEVVSLIDAVRAGVYSGVGTARLLAGDLARLAERVGSGA